MQAALATIQENTQARQQASKQIGKRVFKQASDLIVLSDTSE
jgi:hypothetical protein